MKMEAADSSITFITNYQPTDSNLQNVMMTEW
jgi:hypothetical protein